VSGPGEDHDEGGEGRDVGGLPPAALPRPKVARRPHYSLWLVWLVPLVAVVIGLVLGARSILARGPVVTIYFHNAEGIEAGKTHIKYKDVDVGIVKRVKLTPDHREVEVTAQMRGGEDIESMLVTDTRFWVVRPHVGAHGVSGLNTLLSGAYIAMDVGRNPAEGDVVELGPVTIEVLEFQLNRINTVRVTVRQPETVPPEETA